MIENDAKIMDPDIFLEGMLKSITNFYEKYYHGQYIGKKNYHIREVLENYDKERFSNAKNLYEERSKFLGEMQNLVDNKYIGAF